MERIWGPGYEPEPEQQDPEPAPEPYVSDKLALWQWLLLPVSAVLMLGGGIIAVIGLAGGIAVDGVDPFAQNGLDPVWIPGAVGTVIAMLGIWLMGRALD